MNKNALKTWIENKIIDLTLKGDDPVIESQIKLLQELYDDFNLSESTNLVFNHNLK